MKLSTGLDNYLLVTGSLKAALNLCYVKVYSGTVPADADAAIGSATLLHTYSVSGGATGGTFDATPVSGAIVKTAAESWTGTSVGAAAATFARIVLAADSIAGTDVNASTTAVRAQATIGTVGTDIIVANTTYTTSATRALNAFTIAVPKG